MNQLVLLSHRVAALERRLAMMARHGPVAEVNEAEGWVRLDLGEGDDGPLLSPKIPFAQMAGGLKIHAPPSVGQNMTLFAPSGDMRQAIALPMTWSEENPTPGTGPDPVLTYGDVKATIETGSILIEIGGVQWRLSGEGYAQAGGGVGHDGQDIGATHRHPEVLTGPDNTGTPIAGGPTP